MKFENVYWDAGLMADDAHSASILAIGDSWFWYPFPGGSLLNPLGRVVAGKQHTILAIGNNGAEAFDYVHGKFRTQVFLHNYDYAYPSRKGVFGTKADWLKPALVAARVPARLRHPCIKHLIDQLTKMLEELVKRNPQRIFLVDSRDTLKKGDWANELHPKPAGFKKIAEQKWQPVLSAHGLA